MSLDGDSQEVYERQRPGGSLAKAHAACRAARAAGLPLEITFAPTRLNLHEAGAVIRRARELGAFRFNTGQLMRIGTAARQWPARASARGVERAARAPRSARLRAAAWRSATSRSASRRRCAQSLDEPPATLLVLPNGWVKVAAALPHVCADLRRRSLAEAWRAYRRAWHEAAVEQAVRDALADEFHMAWPTAGGC